MYEYFPDVDCYTVHLHIDLNTPMPIVDLISQKMIITMTISNT